jgi:hypothetical protein
MAWYDWDYLMAKLCTKCRQTCEIDMQFANCCGHCGENYANDGTEVVKICNNCSTLHRNNESSCKKCKKAFITGGWSKD